MEEAGNNTATTAKTSSSPGTKQINLHEMSHLYHMGPVDCQGALSGNQQILASALNTSKLAHWRGFQRHASDYLASSDTFSDCQDFVEDRGYITEPLSDVEEGFPLAYSLVVYRDIEQAERLLRAVYRPQNVYCVNMDADADVTFLRSLKYVVSCFPNVHLLEPRLNVEWGTYSVLNVELMCMEMLEKLSANWKYFINLTGQDFPLKTNRELVEILSKYQGANEIEGKHRGNDFTRRWLRHIRTKPAGVTPIKGSVHVVLSRQFVTFALHSKMAAALREWVKQTDIPDETFFSTLNYNSGIYRIPGSYNIDQGPEMEGLPWYARYKSWLTMPCAGDRVREVCILSTGDLPALHQSPSFFANKFFLDQDRVVYGCLEQRLFNKTRDLYLGKVKVDTSLYSSSPRVKYRLMGS